MRAQDEQKKVSFRVKPEPHNTQFMEAMAVYRFAGTLLKEKKVLDAGCGFGYGANYLAGLAAEVVGVDYDAEAILWARKHYHGDNLSFLKCDLAQLNLSDGYFETICLFEVIHQLSDPVGLLRALAGVLKPGGLFLISTRQRRGSGPAISASHLHVYTLEELMQLLLDSGLKDLRLYGIARPHEVYELENKLQHWRKFDPFSLRKILPRQVISFFSRVISGGISQENFKISQDNIEQSAGLLAVCRK